ncbi:MAG: hypothetical protein GYA15_03495 [Leptolinea sp.]|nr:hypothetical protein [Leptolinea sp.]
MDLSIEGNLERVQRVIAHRRNDERIKDVARQVSAASSSSGLSKHKPVMVFNASTRLGGVSLNAAFALLTGWAMQLEGVPVVHFICDRGMTRCVLGTNCKNPGKEPPCAACVKQSLVNTTDARVIELKKKDNRDLRAMVAGLPLEKLLTFEYQDVPLGTLVLPSLRWILRRNTLMDDSQTRFLMQEYLLSAHRVVTRFEEALNEIDPAAVLVFNGQFFPEASAAWAARKRGIRVISHEVGLMPFTGYFTPGEATAYPIDIPSEFELSSGQNARLDTYLSKRFQGDFSMAGIRFWPEMQGLDQAFLRQAAGFKQIASVFTNVIFDTSQGHANTLFTDMFVWLYTLLEVIRAHPETFFVIRAHPDEKRPGKESRETVAEWIHASGCDTFANVHFVDADEPFSSYDLIRRSKLILVYNSTIGLEASIMGMPVLCAGKARFTQVPSVFSPGSIAEYLRMVEDFLTASDVKAPPEHQRNARRFLYYQLFRSSLPFDAFLEEDRFWKGYVTLKPFDIDALRRQNSVTLDTILHGILEHGDFLLPE